MGGACVLHGGTYHERVFVDGKDGLTIAAHTGEKSDRLPARTRYDLRHHFSAWPCRKQKTAEQRTAGRKRYARCRAGTPTTPFRRCVRCTGAECTKKWQPAMYMRHTFAMPAGLATRPGWRAGKGARGPRAATRPLPPSPQGPHTRRFPPFPQGQPHGTPRRQTPKEDLIASDVETPAPTPNSQSAINRQLIQIRITEPGIIDTTQDSPSCTWQRSGDIEPGETQQHNRATTHAAAQSRSDLPPRRSSSSSKADETTTLRMRARRLGSKSKETQQPTDTQQPLRPPPPPQTRYGTSGKWACTLHYYHPSGTRSRS